MTMARASGSSLATVSIRSPCSRRVRTSVAPLWTANQTIAPLRTRATAYAIIHLGLSAVSGGLAPLAVGFLNDQLAPQLGAEAVRYSLLLVVLTNLWGAYHSAMAARRLPGDIATS